MSTTIRRKDELSFPIPSLNCWLFPSPGLLWEQSAVVCQCVCVNVHTPLVFVHNLASNQANYFPASAQVADVRFFILFLHVITHYTIAQEAIWRKSLIWKKSSHITSGVNIKGLERLSIYYFRLDSFWW